MKKCVSVLLATIVVFSVSTAAQAFDKGTITVNPSSRVRITIFDNDEDGEYTAWQMEAEVGYFIADNIELGLGIGYYDYSESGAYNNNETDIYFRPYAEFYFPTSSNYYYAGLSLYVDKEDNDYSDQYKDETTSITVEGGYKWMVAENISLDFALSYEFGNFDRSGDFTWDYGYNRTNLITGFKLYF